MLPPAREHAQVDAASLLGGREVEDARAPEERGRRSGARDMHGGRQPLHARRPPTTLPAVSGGAYRS